MKVEREGLLAEEPERLIGAILRSIPSRSINDYRSVANLITILRL